jgi:hypothetical protein
MRRSMRVVGLISVITVIGAADLLACGDKFLVGSRGTRYQRPANARPATIVIFADPQSANPVIVGSSRMESLLKREGHRTTTVKTVAQLSAILSSDRFDVIVAASDVADKVQQLIGSSAAVVLSIDTRPTPSGFLRAIDQAIVRHDRALHTEK